MLASSRLTFFSCSSFRHKLRLHSLNPSSLNPKSCIRPSFFVTKLSVNLHSEDHFPLMERFWSATSRGNSSLVDYLQQHGVIKSSKVADVMKKIDRGLFVPKGNLPYSDTPMPIGYNATISAPHMHATCLELLEEHLQPGMRALDVGSEGHAVGVEHIPELVTDSIDNVQKSEAASLLAEGSLSLNFGDGRQGWPDLAPYNSIHVGAAATEVPQPLIEQLKPGGRMVIPVGRFFQDLQVIDKQVDGSLKVRIESSVRYVPLTDRQEQLQRF
ncbi:protein-L-isoaspartate O-methyltransferase isoform X2 [Cryptomeria japonica]|uniref:protein-L-isoaspartate O-methyltransferase isoform X2 n=1 Tax=Cryptomeria japonica TaxID=3369 RepID=UPI0027DA2EBA|nr:protein-L-isoaspartate O-methyltransferase isoform X2 [Cryptomeria japonica]